MVGFLALKVLVGIVALFGGVYGITRMQRRSRAEWRAYDEKYDEDPIPTRASMRARDDH